MSPRSDPDHVVYRSRSQAAAIAACGVVVLIAAIAGLVGTWGTDRFTGMIAIAAVAALIGAFLVLRVGRTALYAGRGGVRIANVWSTHVLGWKDIAAFTKRPYGPAKVTTVDHRTIDVFAIQQSNWANMRGKTDTPADAMVAELNARLAANRVQRVRLLFARPESGSIEPLAVAGVLVGSRSSGPSSSSMRRSRAAGDR